MPRCFITDYKLISYEVLHSMSTKLKGKDRFMALKPYMSKAYDQIEWTFLQTVMLKLGFHPKWNK